jgi:hypothetical protein
MAYFVAQRLLQARRLFAVAVKAKVIEKKFKLKY